MAAGGTRRRFGVAAAAWWMVVAACGGSGGGGASEDLVALETLVEGYPTMAPQQVLDGMVALGPEAYSFLDMYPEVALDMFRQACLADGTIRLAAAGQVYDCQAAWAMYQSSIYGLGEEIVRSQIEVWRQQLLTFLRCMTGKTDAANCQAYFDMAPQIQQGNHETTMRIIANMGDQCLVGVDPGCN